MQHILEGNVFDFRQIGENPLVKYDSLIVPATCRVILTREVQRWHKVMMLVPGPKVFNQKGQLLFLVESYFMRHKFVPFVFVLVNFKLVTSVFVLQVISRWFVNVDLFKNWLSIAHELFTEVIMSNVKS